MFNDKPLIEAMLAGKLEVVKYLLRHGANFANVNSNVLAEVRDKYPDIIEFLRFYFL